MIDPGTLDMSGTNYTLDVEGDLTISNTGTFTPQGSTTHDVLGSWNDAGGTFTPGAGTIILSGNGKTITTAAGNNFFNLTIAAGTKTAGSDLDINGVLTVTGTLAMAANSADVAGITDIDGILSLTTGTFTANGTTDVDGAGTLTIGGTGTYNADGQFTAAGNVTFTAEGNLVCSNILDNTFGTLTPTLGKVTFDAGGAQALPEETFHDLTVNNAANLTMANDVQVDGVLDFPLPPSLSGDIITLDNTLTIGTGGSITNATDDAHVNVSDEAGFLAKVFAGASLFSFPVGNGDILRPIDLTTDAASTFEVRYDDEKFTGGGGNDINTSGSLSDLGDATWNGGHVSGYANLNSTANPAVANTPAIPVNRGYHYNISRSAGTANASLTVVWKDRSQFLTDGPGTPALPVNVTGITWAEWKNTAWEVITSNPTGSIDDGQVNTTANPDFSLTNFTLGSLDGSNYLPIDLVSFDGECIDNQTNLEFVVASQVNNDYFTIKKSTNNLEWEEVGFINGGGTNNEEITYAWTDYSPKSGVNYYKLFQTDIDGISKSFSPIAINCENKVEDYHIYPNPTNDRVSVEFDLEYYQGDDIQMVLKDFKGVIVKSNTIELQRGYNYFELDLSKLQNGFYVLSYSGTKNYIPSKRIVKL